MDWFVLVSYSGTFVALAAWSFVGGSCGIPGRGPRGGARVYSVTLDAGATLTFDPTPVGVVRTVDRPGSGSASSSTPTGGVRLTPQVEALNNDYVTVVCHQCARPTKPRNETAPVSSPVSHRYARTTFPWARAVYASCPAIRALRPIASRASHIPVPLVRSSRASHPMPPMMGDLST